MTSRSSQPLVLEYKKRRYDGGSEIEIIEQIELQYQAYEQQQRVAAAAGAWPAPQYPVNPMGYPMAPQAPQQQPVQQQVAETPIPPPPPAQTQQKLSFKQKMYKAFIMPWIELVLGMSGVMIGVIMSITMLRGDHPNLEILRQEQELLIEQSWCVVHNSVMGIFRAPFTAVALSLMK
jgi:hypothetical protein